MRSIDEQGAARIASALEQTTERVAGEMQAHAESLVTWALEEIHARYQVARRFGAGELAPAASELTREDLERDLLGGPVSGAMDAFEKQRVGLGLGGAAAGAVIGTLIAPGIGTAIGAFLGVFAGFLEGADGLKRECTSAIDARLRPVEEHAVGQLEARRHEIAAALRASVDEAVAEALDRLDQAIGRLMDVERRAIEGARTTLGELRDAQGRLDDHDARLAELVADASKQIAAACIPD
jgi:phage-related tail protein